MIKIWIDYSRLIYLKQWFFKRLILKRAYKGYLKYLELDSESGPHQPVSFDAFRSFEYCQIVALFAAYLRFCKNKGCAWRVSGRKLFKMAVADLF